MIHISRLIRTQSRHDFIRPIVNVQRLLSRTWTNQVGHQAAPLRPSPPTHRPHEHVQDADAPTHVISASQVPDYFSRNVQSWISRYNNKVMDRLMRFGVPQDTVRTVIKTYAAEMKKGTVFPDLQYPKDQLERIAFDVSSNSTVSLDRYFTKILFEWATTPRGQEVLESAVPADVVSRMQVLFRAADLTDVGWDFPWARRGRPRKFIMHVGPTNSGKTHNALRALAAAKRGIYAGPLRLLAYEIFDRLNKGQIVPLGMEADPDVEPDSQSNIDVAEDAGKGEGKNKKVILTKQGNPRFARPCNMVTGEEKKHVMFNAPLLSCTVEMTPITTFWDVAVIDEIQLISDRQRGGSWTSAILGLNAAEIHLCGEESAIPIVQALVEAMGDEIEINRYKRLTPLVVAEKSLEGDLSRVRKGDCTVTFSRTGLFALKRNIEETAGVRCALAYGRLPPEIRSEQAALFNNPNSDYDVLVGSDAIGMGLNLKIKRVIFETVSKFDGGGLRPMSASQIKQIAGRAGRYGMHDGDSVGVVTTLHEKDLDRVREALDAPFEPLRYARLSMSYSSFQKIVRALPWGATNVTVSDIYHFVSKMPPLFEFQEPERLNSSFEFMDQFSDCLTVSSRLLVQNAPCPWRDNVAATATCVMMETYRDKLRVPIDEALHRAKLLKILNKALVMMDGGNANKTRMKMKEVTEVLATLETVHKVIVVYLWFSYRYTVAFPDQVKAFELRRLTELAMDWCLEVMHQLRIKAKNPAIDAYKTISERRPPATVEEPLEETPFAKEMADSEGRWVWNMSR